MQETLITFETAKLAREKGLDISCPFYYQIINLVPSLVEFINTNKDGFEEVSCCYQSCLQKWLRDKFFIQIDVVAYYDEEQLPLHKDNIQKPKGYFFWNYYDEVFSESKAIKFETYEEALELGLQESLKLIKTNESRED